MEFASNVHKNIMYKMEFASSVVNMPFLIQLKTNANANKPLDK